MIRLTDEQRLRESIEELERRVQDVERLDARTAVVDHTGAEEVLASDIRETIREIFGSNSPEFREHRHLQIWAGPMWMSMPVEEIVRGTEKGKDQAVIIINGLIRRLREKRVDLADGVRRAPSGYLGDLNLHPRIEEVSVGLFKSGHPWDAVFAASKALVNYVKERSGRRDLDGARLMCHVFSRDSPVLAFNSRQTTTELDEQEGMMHLFVGAVLGIRNPGGHDFPEGSEQRAVEYLQLLSLLAYRTQEAAI